MADLPTNYFDDILSESMNGKKKFRLTYRNGTTEEVTIEDISEYDQYGSKFGAGDINKINQAVNEKFDSDDVVDPMLTTEPGFAADAYQTKLQFDEQNKKLEQVFQLGTDRKVQVVGSLVNTNLGLTEDSTWDEIIDGLYSLFPDTLNLLTYFTINDWNVSYNADDGYKDIYTNSSRVQFKIGKDGSSTEKQLTAISPDINISSFNTFSYNTANAGDRNSASGSIGSFTAQLICNDGTTYNISNSGSIDISSKSGKAYIKLTAKTAWISAARGHTNCGVYATVLRFDA